MAFVLPGVEEGLARELSDRVNDALGVHRYIEIVGTGKSYRTIFISISAGEKIIGILEVKYYYHRGVWRTSRIEYTGRMPGYVHPATRNEVTMVTIENPDTGPYTSFWTPNNTPEDPLIRQDDYPFRLANYENMKMQGH